MSVNVLVLYKMVAWLLLDPGVHPPRGKAERSGNTLLLITSNLRSEA